MDIILNKKLQIEIRLFNLNVINSLEDEISYDEITSDTSDKFVLESISKDQQCINLLDNHFNIVNNKGMKPLHHMALNYNGKNEISDIIKFINIMVNNGFKIDELDEHGNSPIHYACTNKFSDQLVFSLLKCGSKMLKSNNQNENPLHIAIKSNQCGAIRLLISWFPQFLYDPNLERCCLDAIVFGNTNHNELFNYIRSLRKFVVWLHKNNYLKYINIFILLELSNPFSIIRSGIEGTELVDYAYSLGKITCDNAGVPS